MSKNTHLPNTLNLFVLNPSAEPDLTQLAVNLDVPLVNSVEPGGKLYLSRENGNLSLSQCDERDDFSILVDFSSGETSHRLKQGHGKNQPLAKAIGLNKNSSPTVVDATAGLGRDSFVLASLGCKVIMLERSPVVAALLDDGLQRGKTDEHINCYMQNIQLHNVDAVDFLNRCEQSIDVVYLDPMFPERKKSAKVKKQMQILQRLLGHQQDDPNLLDAALACAIKRVVVKRPKGAEPYCDRLPTHTIESKKMRYDVYMCG